MYPGMNQGPSGSGGMVTNPDILKFFQAVDKDNNGRIAVKELQAALVNTQGNNFSETVCALMIKLYGKEQRGSLNLPEFQNLLTNVNKWFDAFRKIDRNNNGYVEEHELQQALTEMGYRFHSNFLSNVVFGNNPRLTADHYMEFSMKLDYFTNMFKERDTQRTGNININYEDFLNICMGGI